MPTGTGPPSHPPNPALPFREDCWSEGATAVLIDAWGDRFMEVNRGHIRQKQWDEVADAVNSRRTAVKRPIRSAIQCKNRIDTIKKKYKAEKARVVESGETATSQWPFFSRLDYLISDASWGTNNAPPSPPLALPLPHRKSHPVPPPAAVAIPPFARPKSAPLGALLRKGNYSAAAAAAAAASPTSAPARVPTSASTAVKVEAEENRESSASSSKKFGRKRMREMNGRSTDGLRGDNGEIRELAQAILKFGAMYERIESAKQKQMMELEKQRMEFTKRIEFQRMQVFVESLVRIEKARCPKKQHNLSGSGDESKVESLKP